MINIKPFFIDILENEINKHNAIKINCELFGSYILASHDIRDIKSHITKNKILQLSTDLNEFFKDTMDNLRIMVEEFTTKQSGWAIEKLLFLEINSHKYLPLKGSSFIRLPQDIGSKKAIINVVNNDNCCFAWAITSAVCQPTGNPSLMSSYPHFSTLFNFDGIEFPVALKTIPKFESQNNLSINVYGIDPIFENGKCKHQIIGPLHYTTKKRPVHINLLLLDDSQGKTHYCFIKSFSRLLSAQISNYQHKVYFCDGCLQYFYSQEKLEKHLKNDCEFVSVRLPTLTYKINKYGDYVPENILKFESFEKQIKAPFVVYADFECILKPIRNDTNEESNDIYTIKKCEHIPYSFAYFIKCSYDDSLSKLEIYNGDNAPVKFIEMLDADVKKIYKNHLKIIKPLALTKEEETAFLKETHCFICQKPFDKYSVPVREHCHYSGNWRGAAHSKCNLNYRQSLNIPIIFHNLKSYDSHLFLPQLARNKERLSVIAQTKEKYITFSKYLLVDQKLNKNGKKENVYMQMRFIDSLQFLPNSLETLASALSREQCVEIINYFKDDDKIDLIRQKGVFPYSYLDHVDKLKERSLPNKKQFYNELKDEHVSDEDYQRALKVWRLFDCETLEQYFKLYLISDVLILTDVFENYRDICMKLYKLEATAFVSSPSLSFFSALLHSKIELQLLCDIDMLHFFKNNIRGGVSTCVKRKAVANNPFLPNYDRKKETSYIIYLDATNLYGYAMSQYLPMSNFSWLSAEEITVLTKNVSNFSATSNEGYVLECSLIYPEFLHNDHNDMPFCPETVTPPDGSFPKLIPNLTNKERYVIHYMTLKQAVSYGLILKKIHRGVKFHQEPYLKSYVALNTEMRNKAKTKFEGNVYKNKINSLFGKTLENIDNRINMRLVSTWEKNKKRDAASNLICKPNFKDVTVFSENLIAVQMQKLHCYYNKPLYIGFCILDIAKSVVYEFYYGYLKEMYGDKVSLLYTDTDSLVVEVKTSNFYHDMKLNLDHFDTSNFKPNNIHNIPVNKSIIGKMKDEYAGNIIKSFYGTSAKAYCIQLADFVDKKAKGVNKAAINKQLEISHYQNIVEGNVHSVYCTMYMFKSIKHNIYTELVRKLALNCIDDKRFIIPDSVNTLAWGHKNIVNYLSDDQRSDKRLSSLLKEFQQHADSSKVKKRKCKKRLMFEQL